MSRVKHLFLPLLCALLLTSCAVGPNFKKPEAPEVKSFTRDPDRLEQNQANIPIAQDWWKAYGSDELNQLVELALKNNPEIGIAQANLRIARQNTIYQRGYFFPRVGLGYGFARQNVGGTIEPEVIDANRIYNLHISRLMVGFVPDIFGGNRRRVEALRAIEKAEQYQLDALRITITTNVIATAIQEAVFREQLELLEEFLAVSYEQLIHNRGLAENGYSSWIDLANQEAAYAEALARVPAIRLMREQTLNLLAVLCGQIPSQELLLPDLASIHIPDPLPSVLPSNFINQRPDVKIAEELIRAANAQIGAAIADMFPQISIFGAIGGAAEVFSEMFNGINNIWGAAADIDQPLFVGGSLRAMRRAAEAGRDGALAHYRNAVLTALQNISDTLYAIDNDRRIYQAAQKNLKAHESVYWRTRKLFEHGHSSDLDRLEARQQLIESRMNYTEAFATFLGDTVALHQALGGGWRDPDIKDDPGAREVGEVQEVE